MSHTLSFCIVWPYNRHIADWTELFGRRNCPDVNMMCTFCLDYVLLVVFRNIA